MMTDAEDLEAVLKWLDGQVTHLTRYWHRLDENDRYLLGALNVRREHVRADLLALTPPASVDAGGGGGEHD